MKTPSGTGQNSPQQPDPPSAKANPSSHADSDRAELLAKLRAIDAEPSAQGVEPVAGEPASVSPVSVEPQTKEPTSPDPASQTSPERAALLAELAELDRQPIHPAPPPTSHATPRPTPTPRPRPTPAPPASSRPSRATDYPLPSLIEQLTQYAKEKLEARAERQRQRQEQEAIAAKAQAWLDALDPLSDDGFWFEQFAENYRSRLEAAIVFLNPKKTNSPKNNDP